MPFAIPGPRIPEEWRILTERVGDYEMVAKTQKDEMLRALFRGTIAVFPLQFFAK